MHNLWFIAPALAVVDLMFTPLLVSVLRTNTFPLKLINSIRYNIAEKILNLRRGLGGNSIG